MTHWMKVGEAEVVTSPRGLLHRSSQSDFVTKVGISKINNQWIKLTACLWDLGNKQSALYKYFLGSLTVHMPSPELCAVLEIHSRKVRA